MLNRKFALITTLVLTGLLASGSVFAQRQGNGPGKGMGMRDARGGPPSVAQRMARMADRLDLSDEQAVEMLELMQAHDAQRQALWDANAQLMTPDVCAMRQAHQEEILGILDDEQDAAFLALIERGLNRNPGRRGGGDFRGLGGFDCSGYLNDD